MSAATKRKIAAEWAALGTAIEECEREVLRCTLALSPWGNKIDASIRKMRHVAAKYRELCARREELLAAGADE